MTILNLSAQDYGGAGKFAVDFHRLLLEAGHQSYLVVKESKTNKSGISQYQDKRFSQPIGKLMRKIRKRTWTDKVFDYDYYFYNKYERYTTVSVQQIIDALPATPDVIFLHWVTDFINARMIWELKHRTNARIYWFLTDNAPLTGGCHYPWNCRGFEQNCQNCPAIVPTEYKWLATENLASKKKYLPDDLGVITFSNSDFERAQRSALYHDKRIVKLMGYVDEKLYKPGNRTLAKAHFGLPDNKTIIFFGASYPKEKRKGMSLLLQALALLNQNDYYLLIAGTMPGLIGEFPARQVGHLSEEELILAYQAADMFVCPSVEDSGPMMINQSLMCGTPVVAFNTGVAQDLVLTGETGYRVASVDPKSLAAGIESITRLSVEGYADLSHRCRTYAEKMLSREVYLSQLASLLNESGTIISC